MQNWDSAGMLIVQQTVIIACTNYHTCLILEGISLSGSDVIDVGSYNVWSQDNGQVTGVH